MLRPSMYQIISKNESYYSLVIGVAKRARDIAQQRYEEKEKEKKAAEKRGTSPQDHKARLDDKMLKALMMEENPVKTAVDEFAAGKYRIVEHTEDDAD